MYITEQELRNKILGCWFGKNVGGTLGAPYEWRRQINNVTFYQDSVNGEPLPNDDLDIQLLWLIAMEQQGIGLSAETLAHYWEVFVTPHWAEYGIAKANMKLGLIPPLSGSHHNLYKDSCGSYIRSEIWACVAPGTPALSAELMLRDSQIDHGGRTEGTYAAVFIAALESAAFVESDIRKLIETGLSYIPAECDIAKVIRMVIGAYEAGKTYIEARDMILEAYRGEPFTYFENGEMVKLVSDRDRALGFDKGRKGYDVVDNVGLIAVGLLYGEGDFANSMLCAINCGEDTDCTAATIGSIFGIIMGYDNIPEKWKAPIGTGIRTVCLNHGEIEGKIPADIYDLTERTFRLYRRFELQYPVNLHLGAETGGTSPALACNPYVFDALYRFADCAYHSFTFFDVAVRYDDGAEWKEGGNAVTLFFVNRYATCEHVEIAWQKKEGITVDQPVAAVFLPQDKYGDHIQSAVFHLTAENPAAVELLTVTVRMTGRVCSAAFTVPFVRGCGQKAVSVEARETC